MKNTPSNEWYTPSCYIAAARAVMGKIDLDPASCELANQTVRATQYYTKEQDGLRQPWSGRVWLNPPFSASISCSMPQFTWGSRLISEYHGGNVEEAILLIMSASKQRWFHRLWNMHDGLVCFSEKRIHFNRPQNRTQELRESTCFVYLGPNENRFIEQFSKFGTLARRVEKPQPSLITRELW